MGKVAYYGGSIVFTVGLVWGLYEATSVLVFGTSLAASHLGMDVSGWKAFVIPVILIVVGLPLLFWGEKHKS